MAAEVSTSNADTVSETIREPVQKKWTTPPCGVTVVVDLDLENEEQKLTIHSKSKPEDEEDEALSHITNTTMTLPKEDSSSNYAKQKPKRLECVGNHFPELMPEKMAKSCSVCSNVTAYSLRRPNGKLLTRHQTRYWCPDCKTPLCISPRPCFKRYHTEVEYFKQVEELPVPVSYASIRSNPRSNSGLVGYNPVTTTQDFTKPDFTKPDLSKPDFDKPDFSKPDFDKPDFPKPDFDKPDFSKPDFDKPDFSKPDFDKPDFSKPDFDKPDFSKPDFTKPDFSKPDFTKPDFSKPDFTKHDFTKNDYPKADFSKTDFSKADLSMGPAMERNDNNSSANSRHLEDSLNSYPPLPLVPPRTTPIDYGFSVPHDYSKHDHSVAMNLERRDDPSSARHMVENLSQSLNPYSHLAGGSRGASDYGFSSSHDYSMPKHHPSVAMNLERKDDTMGSSMSSSMGPSQIVFPGINP